MKKGKEYLLKESVPTIILNSHVSDFSTIPYFLQFGLSALCSFSILCGSCLVVIPHFPVLQ